MQVIVGYILASFVGISLGLIGSGGSILALPVLVYIMGVNPILATAYSLFIVGSTALIGGIQNAIQKTVNFKTVFIFGIPSIVTVYVTRIYLIPLIPQNIVTIGSLVITKSIALMLIFAIVMIFASFTMIRTSVKNETNNTLPITYNYPMLLLQGLIVGMLTGLVGAGGGFLIIPALVFFARMPMKLAIGTSLFIVAANALIGFIGNAQTHPIIDWQLLSLFTIFAIAGIFIGIVLGKKVPGEKLKKAFGWFILCMGIHIIIKEVFL